MPALKNIRHERFAQEYAQNGNASEAWRQATGKVKDADAHAATFMVINGMQARIQEIRQAQADKAELKKDDLRRWCERILLAKPSEASDDSDICETVMTKAGPFTSLCSKQGAFDRLAKLCGYFEPEKQEHSGVVEIIVRKL